MVLRYSWHACERVRVRSRRKTRFSASASVWNQLAAAGGAVSAIEHPADGATGGARGRLVLRCSWLACAARSEGVRDPAQYIHERLLRAEVATVSAIQHPGLCVCGLSS